MNHIITQALVLGRIEYGEADRIITVLTPDQGKLRLMAKGVRKVKSKLAGGIELFSVSSITFIRGKGDIGTLVSTRLITHYGSIINNIDRVQLGYELIKQLDKAVEDEPEAEYFTLLQQAFEALDDRSIDLQLIRVWFSAQLLRFGGSTPNLSNDIHGAQLSADQRYEFGLDEGAFRPQIDGAYDANDIKFLRLLFGANVPSTLAKIGNAARLVERTQPLVLLWQQQYIH
jgi:DNA repair protein RecO (recombination protein O)